MPSEPGDATAGRSSPAERAPAAAGRAEPGRVASFDVEAGLGVVEDGQGKTYPFHCSAITDGSRWIEVDRRVIFAVGAGGPGRWEALAVTPV